MKKFLLLTMTMTLGLTWLGAQEVGEFYQEIEVGAVKEGIEVVLKINELTGVVLVNADEEALTLDVVEEDGEEALKWEPARNRMMATYENIWFLAENFREMIGDPEAVSGAYTLQLSVFRIKDSPKEESKGKGARPDGGFTFTNYLGWIEAATPVTE